MTREIDLIEEVSRIFGFENFPPRLPVARTPSARLPHAPVEDRIRERLIALGYQEIVTIPLVDPAADELFRTEDVVPAVIGNPLAEDASIMRTSGALSMVQTLEWNLNRGQRNLKLFEVGKRYEIRDGAPHESRILTLGASGMAREKSIHEDAREVGFADLKGDLDQIGALAGRFRWETGGSAWLLPSRAATLWVTCPQERPAGSGGQLANGVAEQFKLRQDVYLAELDLEILLRAVEAAEASLRYEPLPRYPAVVRDFSLILGDGVAFGQVAEEIRNLGIPEVRQIEAKDLYRGKNLPAGKHSLLVQVTFQSTQATLTDAQVAELSSRIVSALERNLGASLRTF